MKKKTNLSYSDKVVLEKIGTFIKTKRKEKKLTLKNLAELAFKDEFAAKNISMIENGKVPNVSFLRIARILKKLDIDII